MNRLPEKFEKTVLSKHGIEWYYDGYYTIYKERLYGNIKSPYEIAAIGLESIKIVCIPLSSGDRWQISIQSSWTIIEDRDFCTCINRAIIEIYGTKEEKDAANKKL